MEQMELMPRRLVGKMLANLHMESEVKLRKEMETDVYRHRPHLCQQEQQMVDAEVNHIELTRKPSHGELECGNWLISRMVESGGTAFATGTQAAKQSARKVYSSASLDCREMC